MTNKDKIANLLADMRFERRPPVTKQKKARYAVLEAETNDVMNEVRRLHLRLWHAVSRHDYHSLSLDEARQALDDIRRQLDSLSQSLIENK